MTSWNFGNIRTTEETIQGRIRNTRFIASIYGIFGVSALALSAAGIFGVFSFSLRERIREFGIRLALGEPRLSIARLIFRQAGIMLCVGIVFGTLAGYGFIRVLSGFYTIGQPERVDFYFSAGVIVGLTGILAVLGPLLRATRVDPMRALRVTSYSSCKKKNGVTS